MRERWFGAWKYKGLGSRFFAVDSILTRDWVVEVELGSIYLYGAWLLMVSLSFVCHGRKMLRLACCLKKKKNHPRCRISRVEG